MNGEDHSHGMNNNNMSEQQRSTADSPLADALQSDEYHKLASLAMYVPCCGCNGSQISHGHPRFLFTMCS